MKGQVTMELLLLFSVMLLVISMLSQALFYSYSISIEKSRLTQQRALIENDILMYEILCNGDLALPVQFKSPFATGIKPYKWSISLAVNGSQSSDFSGIFTGCHTDGDFV